MSPGVIVLIVSILLASLVLLLTFVGPEDRTSGFWYYIQRIRRAMDMISYWIFCIFGIGAILIVIIYGGYRLLIQLGVL